MVLRQPKINDVIYECPLSFEKPDVTMSNADFRYRSLLLHERCDQIL